MTAAELRRFAGRLVEAGVDHDTAEALFLARTAGADEVTGEEALAILDETYDR